MTDVLTKKQRSYCMSQIKSRWTKPERIVHNWLKGNKIKHKMHPKIEGNPDVLIYPKMILLIHGCFWHKCSKCYRQPKSNKRFWNAKIEKNVMRDQDKIKKLKHLGYKIIVIWEHEIKKNRHKKILQNIK
jgi:DNA mismatch endonuclease (patch repair protein)